MAGESKECGRLTRDTVPVWGLGRGSLSPMIIKDKPNLDDFNIP